MTLYWGFVILGTLAVLIFWKLHSHISMSTALFTLLFSSLCGLLLAKLVYILTQSFQDLLDFGPEILLETDPSTFSFFGGAAGALLGIVIACKITHVSISASLDSFAPFGALLICVFRGGEYFLGTLGAGPMMMESSPFSVFPVALFNNYQEAFFSVPFLEILCGCACAFLFLNRQYPENGMKLQAVLFYLALPQVISESLRLRCMKWGFVRVEQVFCGVLMLVLIILSCKKKCFVKNWFHHWERSVSFLLLILLVVSIEYALDKSALGIFFCYAMMIVILLIMGFSYASAFWERKKE